MQAECTNSLSYICQGRWWLADFPHHRLLRDKLSASRRLALATKVNPLSSITWTLQLTWRADLPWWVQMVSSECPSNLLAAWSSACMACSQTFVEAHLEKHVHKLPWCWILIFKDQFKSSIELTTEQLLSGIGKSTLLNLISGSLEPTSGVISRSQKVRMATFNQHHVDGIDLALTPIQALLEAFPLSKDQEIRYYECHRDDPISASYAWQYKPIYWLLNIMEMRRPSVYRCDFLWEPVLGGSWMRADHSKSTICKYPSWPDDGLQVTSWVLWHWWGSGYAGHVHVVWRSKE